VNGEIYNHLDIKSKLSPKHTFTTGSDCEAVMHLYAEHGAAAVVQWMNQLEGMFGFCLCR
jgi:asparagine synthase (glutamine-hydrolysing)